MPQPEINVGYPALSHVMARQGLSMYNRFSALNTRNLLYMQVELLDLQEQLEVVSELDYEDVRNEGTRAFATSCKALMRDGGEQWQLVLKIREKLDAYNNTLIQQAELSRIETARKYDHELLQRFVLGPQAKVNLDVTTEKYPFRDDAWDDMIVVRPRQERDSFTNMISERLLPWLSRKLLHRWKKAGAGYEASGIREWDEKHFSNLVRIMSVLISTLFPSIAVLSLYYIKKLSVRLWAVLLFSLLFSGILAAFTRARPIEIFAATAACASVQVVFVGSTSTL